MHGIEKHRLRYSTSGCVSKIKGAYKRNVPVIEWTMKSKFVVVYVSHQTCSMMNLKCRGKIHVQQRFSITELQESQRTRVVGKAKVRQPEYPWSAMY